FDVTDALTSAPRFRASLKWRKLPGLVSHVFTHFPVELTVFTAPVARGARAPKDARWVKLNDLQGEALPTVMRKVLAHALDRPPS
ncbi:MAG: NUDIX domain-containing protein, partial [Pseudolabrys sp.]